MENKNPDIYDPGDTNEPVLLTKTIDDLFNHIGNNQRLKILGGCTRETMIDGKAVTIRGIPELCTVERRERFMEFGAGATLNKILELGKNKIPLVLYQAIKTIGTHSVRNLATIGGNICAPGQKLTLWAPLLALDAKLEIKKSPLDSKIIPMSKFTEVPQKSILSKIRVPLSEWKMEIFQRVGPSSTIADTSASFAFLANVSHGKIDVARVVFAGIVLFHPTDLENEIIGEKVPIKKDDINRLMKTAEKTYDDQFSNLNVNAILKTQFLNLLRACLERLS
ncbi:MAG TPA: hypothetical protein DCM57_01320 [Treponema sp.]|jgi:CO/xanthine dehydrogenase FAD-binding subunit|nr:hypothetical protein [Treponema sp.]HBB42278.1 hypothetical protein [Treponema sp.]